MRHLLPFAVGAVWFATVTTAVTLVPPSDPCSDGRRHSRAYHCPTTGAHQ